MTRQKAREFCSLFPGLAQEELVLAILCILDTNTFQVLAPGSAHNLAGLYPRVALLNHGCVPNCRLIFKSDQRLEVRASVAIKKGAGLLISYTPPFYTVIARNTILQRGKQFTCSCPRCSDPQELGLKERRIRRREKPFALTGYGTMEPIRTMFLVPVQSAQADGCDLAALFPLSAVTY